MVVTVLLSPYEIRALQPQWARLYDVSGCANAFLHPAWCVSWIDCYQPPEVRVLVEHDDGGALDVLAAFTASGSGGRHWSTLGAPFVDFGTPLVAPGLHCPDALTELLRTHRSRWRFVRLSGLDESLARALTDGRPRSGVEFRIVDSETCPRISVPSFDAWASSLPGSRWKRLAAVRRRVENCPDTRYLVVEDPVDIGRAVRSFDALRLQSWWNRGRLRQLAPPVRSVSHLAFLRMAVGRMAAAGVASVVELRVGTRLVAASVLFWTPSAVLVALKATDTRLGSSMSPGLALDIFTIELAAQRGVTRVEFGRGDERYKFVLGAQQRMTHHVIAMSSGARLPLLCDTARRKTNEAAYAWRMRRSS